MKTKRFLAAIGVATALTVSLAACDHLIPKKGDEIEAEANAAEKKEPVNVMPGGDRYGGNSGPSQ